MQWGPLLLKEGGMIRMENGIHPWYSYAHVIHPPMVFIHPLYLFTHGIVSDPWYVSTHGIHPHMGFTHGIVSGIYPWYWPMVSTHGIVTQKRL